jgi:hypothetical protein
MFPGRPAGASTGEAAQALKTVGELLAAFASSSCISVLLNVVF